MNKEQIISKIEKIDKELNELGVEHDKRIGIFELLKRRNNLVFKLRIIEETRVRE